MIPCLNRNPTQQMIDKTHNLLNQASRSIFSQLENAERASFCLQDSRESIECALLHINDPEIALSHATDVLIDISNIAIEVFKSQNPMGDLSKIENNLKIINLAEDDFDFPDSAKGDIFAQTSNVMKASKRVLNFVINATSPTTCLIQ